MRLGAGMPDPIRTRFADAWGGGQDKQRHGLSSERGYPGPGGHRPQYDHERDSEQTRPSSRKCLARAMTTRGQFAEMSGARGCVACRLGWRMGLAAVWGWVVVWGFVANSLGRSVGPNG